MPAQHPGAAHFIEWTYQIWLGIKQKYEEVHGPGSLKVYRTYTPADLNPVYQRIVQAEINGTLLDSTVELLSGGIMAHAFGNANHRTFINAARLYLHANQVLFPAYDVDRDTQRWVNDASSYFTKSKTVKRKLVEFSEYDPGLHIRVRQNHGIMTRRWLEEFLAPQSGILMVAGIASISSVICSGLRSG